MSRMHFFKGLTWLLALNVLIKPVWVFGIDRVVQNRVGLEAYGIYFSQLGLCITLGFLSDMGLTSLVNRELASGGVMNIRRLLFFKAAFSVLYIVVVCCVGWITGVKDWSVLIAVVVIQLLTSFFLFLRAIVTAAQKFGTDAWLSIIDKSILIICCSILLYTSLSVPISLPLFLLLQIGALLIAVIVAGIIVGSFKNADNLTPLEWRGLLQKSAPFLILILSMSAHNRLDAFLLYRLHSSGTYEAGVYAAAYRLLDAGNMAGYLVASFLVPYAAKNINNVVQLKGTADILSQVLLSVAVPVVSFVVIFAPSIREWLYPALPDFDPQVLSLCIAALPAYYLTHIYGSLLTAKGALKPFSIIVGTCLAINIMLNILLIPKGAFGCCIAALVSQYLCAIGCIIASGKLVSVGIKFSSLVVLSAAGVLFLSLFYFGRQALLPVWFMVALAVGLTALLMFAAWQRSKKRLAAF